MGALVAASSALAALPDTATLMKLRGSKSAPLVSPSVSIVDSTFFLSPGDQLRLRWWGMGMGDEVLQVNSRGIIVVPDIGNLAVRGVRFDHVQDSLEAMVRRRTPIRLFDLQIVRVSQALVPIHGLVPHPGPYTLAPGTLLSEALREAGLTMDDYFHWVDGSTPPLPSLRNQIPSMRRVLLVRGGGRDTVWCDLVRAFNSGDADQNPPLFHGDRVEVLPLKSLVALSGSGANTGLVEAIPGETVRSFLRAGRIDAPPSLATGRLVDGRTVELTEISPMDSSLAVVETGARQAPPFPRVVWVSGNIRTAGGYVLEAGMTAKDLVRKAGGIPGGDDSGYVLAVKRGWTWLRPSNRATLETTTQYPEVRTALAAYAAMGRGAYSTADQPLQPGDSVLVEPANLVVWVGGQVNHPGFVAWKKGASFEDYVSDAGGYSFRPWASRARLYNLHNDQIVPTDQPIPPGTAIIIPERRYISPDQWLTLAATVMSLTVSMVSLYIMASAN